MSNLLGINPDPTRTRLVRVQLPSGAWGVYEVQPHHAFDPRDARAYGRQVAVKVDGRWFFRGLREEVPVVLWEQLDSIAEVTS